eukprot:747393_1
MACIAIAARRGGRSFSASAFAISNRSASTTNGIATNSLPFVGRTASMSTSASSITKLQTATVEEIEKIAVIEHPSYEIISKESVDEYGAYCTMYRHKKT